MKNIFKKVPLAYKFILPAGVMIILFFFIPIILTFCFSFTTMSSGTGLYGNRFVFTELTYRKLKESGISDQLYQDLKQQSFAFDNNTLEKLKGDGFNSTILGALKTQLGNKSFSSEEETMSAIKAVINSPRPFRDRKRIIQLAEKSLQNKEFYSEEQLEARFNQLKIETTPQQRDKIFQATNTSWQWTTNNYTEIFSSLDSLRILKNTFFYVVLTLGLFNIGLALVLALVTFYMPTRQAKFFRAVWLIPRITPAVLYVLLWKSLADHNGVISYIVGLFGVAPTNWIGEFPWITIILLNGFVGSSMAMIIFSSAMQAIPKTLLFASAISGAYRWQQIRRVILPQMRWPILFMASYQTLSLLTSFEYIQLSTDGGPARSTEVWALHAFHTALNNYYGNLRYGYGSTLAVVLVVVGVTASLLYLRFFKFGELTGEPPIED